MGFVNDANEIVQFIRHGTEQWLVDAPVVEAGKFAYSLQGRQRRRRSRRSFGGSLRAGFGGAWSALLG
jgi:hypothetical protein